MTGAGVACARPRCGHDYRDHAPGGGNCRRDGGACPCPGFQWVDPTAVSGGYSTPPRPA